jgi:hypothetical protein
VSQRPGWNADEKIRRWQFKMIENDSWQVAKRAGLQEIEIPTDNRTADQVAEAILKASLLPVHP